MVDGWDNAYYQQFSGGSGETRTRPIVVSYSTSPAAEVMFAEDPQAPPPRPTSMRTASSGVEYAGVLAGARNEAGAKQFVDFMLSRSFQDDIGSQMFVYPVVEGRRCRRRSKYAPTEPRIRWSWTRADRRRSR